MEIGFESVQHRENCLTVIRGCLGTVLVHWDRLDEPMKKTLLETAMEKVIDLVHNLEDDVAPMRRSLPYEDQTLDVRSEPSSAVTTG